MDEQTGSSTQQQGLGGAGPLLVSAAAGAAAGAVAVLARKALSGRGDEGSSGQSGSRDGGTGGDATRFDEVDRVADDLASLVDELRSAGGDEDSKRLVEIADTISEYADEAAGAFNAKEDDADAEAEGSAQRVSEDLMSRVRELTGGEREEAGSGSSRGAAEPSRA